MGSEMLRRREGEKGGGGRECDHECMGEWMGGVDDEMSPGRKKGMNAGGRWHGSMGLCVQQRQK